MSTAINFKGIKDGIVTNVPEEATFEQVLETLKDKLIESISFFAGSKVSIMFSGKSFSEQQQEEIKKMVVQYVGEEVEIQFDYKEPKGKQLMRSIDLNEGITKFHKGTVRSGQTLRTKGNLVIIGDVNPGADLSARGNIVVMGNLRGIVHAGCDGNREAYVVALSLHPVQLRIADIITRSPDDGEMKYEMYPEIAYVKEDTIFIDTFLNLNVYKK
ncbi:MAG: septum site-determining protein MinC [Hyphomonadaceae bacterium]|nr:septum site-determining protein MinC [Clostridia bacterium]